MILKKPYAFLIRYFKLIHFLILIFIIMLSINYNKIISFFIDYNSTTISLEGQNIREIISSSLYLYIIIIIIINILMFLLMKSKNKPNKIYLFSIIYYIVLFIAIVYSKSVILSLLENGVTQQNLRAYQDIFRLVFVPNFYFLIIFIIRAIGFDIKKFNFAKDLQELKIGKEDSEEFEFVLGNDLYKYKRQGRRKIRELKYYFLENKLYIIIISVIAIVLLLVMIIPKINKSEKMYNENEVIPTANFSYKINNTYITKYDYTGKIINPSKKYLIVDMEIKSNNKEKILPPEYLYIVLKDKTSINFKTTLKESFSDIGQLYQNSKIDTKYNNYIFIFELSNEIKDDNYILKIFNSQEYNNSDTSNYSFVKCKLNPYSLDQEINLEEQTLKKSINLGKIIYNNLNMIVNSLEIKEYYEYEYEKCINDICSKYTDIAFPNKPSNQKLLILKYKFIEENNKNISLVNKKNILSKIFQISYKIGNEIKIEQLNSRIITNVNDTLFIDIPNYALKYDEVKLVLKTREKSYSFSIQ